MDKVLTFKQGRVPLLISMPHAGLKLTPAVKAGLIPEAQSLPDTDWRSLATVLGIACSLLVAAMTAWTLYQRPAIDPARRLWLTALRQLARRQVDCAPWETPTALAQRVRKQRPELAETFQNVVDAYLEARYGKSNNNLNALREAIARLR